MDRTKYASNRYTQNRNWFLKSFDAPESCRIWKTFRSNQFLERFLSWSNHIYTWVYAATRSSFHSSFSTRKVLEVNTIFLLIIQSKKIMHFLLPIVTSRMNVIHKISFEYSSLMLRSHGFIWRLENWEIELLK